VTAVNRITGEVLASCTEAEARALTDRIKSAAEQTWALLTEAHERRAWSPLGYDRWEDYVRAEFDMTRQNAYYLLNQGRVIREISAAAGMTTNVDIPEWHARDLKPVLPQVVDTIRERVASEPHRPPVEIVRDVVTETRREVREERAHNPIAAAKAEAARQPVILGHKAVERFVQAARTVQAAGGGAEIAADLDNYPNGDDFWTEGLDEAAAALDDFRGALRRRKMRSVR
jgi:hypothetical protein